MTNQVWEAAEFLAEWDDDDNNGLRYKLFSVPREAVDEDSDEDGCFLLLGIERETDIRRIDIMLDSAFGRELSKTDRDEVREALRGAPTAARKTLCKYRGGAQ